MEFHVHIDASNFSLGVMLQQNPDNNIDKSIYSVNRLMSSAKKKLFHHKKGSVGHDLCNKEILTVFTWKYSHLLYRTSSFVIFGE